MQGIKGLGVPAHALLCGKPPGAVSYLLQHRPIQIPSLQQAAVNFLDLK
jgi:hypothetical protein